MWNNKSFRGNFSASNTFYTLFLAFNTNLLEALEEYNGSSVFEHKTGLTIIGMKCDENLCTKNEDL